MKNIKAGESFDFKRHESLWNTTDNEGYHYDWGEPNNELIVYADKLAKWIFENNPWGYLYNYLGELPWEHNLWDIAGQEELVQRVIDVLQGEVENQLPMKDSRQLVKFLHCIDFVQDEK